MSKLLLSIIFVKAIDLSHIHIFDCYVMLNYLTLSVYCLITGSAVFRYAAAIGQSILSEFRIELRNKTKLCS